jgi:hypothetical protein
MRLQLRLQVGEELSLDVQQLQSIQLAEQENCGAPEEIHHTASIPGILMKTKITIL